MSTQDIIGDLFDAAVRMARQMEVTHVLSWVPASFIEGPAVGCWELRSAAADAAGDPPEYDGANLPRYARAEELALVVESQVGFPVELEAYEQEIRLTVPVYYEQEIWLTVPVYYARRAS